MIICFTGHRPNKLGGYKIPNPKYLAITRELKAIITKISPDAAISGMALGIDTWAANICVKLNIPFLAAVPFEGQEKMWPIESQEQYKELLSKASAIKIVSEGGYSVNKMQIRNEYMVDNSDLVVAVYDGTAGGTKNCITYAESKNKEIIKINPNALEF